MIRRCKVSDEEFQIETEDLEFYRQIGVPEPTLSPLERNRRRLSFGCQRHLFSRICAFTGKKIISNFPPELPYRVVDIEQFYQGSWDQYATGRAYDFKRPFFEQYKKLMLAAVYPALLRAYFLDENSEYTHHAGGNRDCYFLFDSDDSRQCLYCYSVNQCTDCLDCFRATKCELCYELIDCHNCYGSAFLQNCENCSDSWFLKNCIGCAECFGCVNLRNKRYYFFNQALSKEEYTKKLSELALGSRQSLRAIEKRFEEFQKSFPRRFTEGVQNENVIGGMVSESKNAVQCFDSRRLWDCKYVVQAFDDCKNCFDCSEVGNEAELLYECAYAGRPAYNCKFCACMFPNAINMTYCFYTTNCKDCFGCVGIHGAQYCILNKPYAESEYKELVPRIIDHMTKTKEWGEFFPAELSPFPYNLTHAHDFYPLSQSEAEARGYRWYEFPDRTNEVKSPPDSGADDALLGQVMVCPESRRPFRFQKAELAFYRKMKLPTPDLEFNARHLRRRDKRPPWILFERTCQHCGKALQSSIAPNQGEVLCEKHFQEACDVT